MIDYIVKTTSPEETEDAGRELAKLCAWEKSGFIALYGEMGAGKTAFVRGIASFAAPGAVVTSPTYSIVNEYTPGGANRPTLFHFDMYRVSGWDDLDSIDFESYFLRGALIVTEWSENIEFALPERYVRADIEKIGDCARCITVKEIGSK